MHCMVQIWLHYENLKISLHYEYGFNHSTCKTAPFNMTQGTSFLTCSAILQTRIGRHRSGYGKLIVGQLRNNTNRDYSIENKDESTGYLHGLSMEYCHWQNVNTTRFTQTPDSESKTGNDRSPQSVKLSSPTPEIIQLQLYQE